MSGIIPTVEKLKQLCFDELGKELTDDYDNEATERMEEIQVRINICFVRRPVCLFGTVVCVWCRSVYRIACVSSCLVVCGDIGVRVAAAGIRDGYAERYCRVRNGYGNHF